MKHKLLKLAQPADLWHTWLKWHAKLKSQQDIQYEVEWLKSKKQAAQQGHWGPHVNNIDEIGEIE